MHKFYAAGDVVQTIYGVYIIYSRSHPLDTDEVLYIVRDFYCPGAYTKYLFASSIKYKFNKNEILALYIIKS